MSRRSHRIWSLAGIAVVLLSFGAMFLLQQRIDRTREALQQVKLVDEMMYFPSGTMLRPIAGEYRMLVADYAWLRAVQYYAYHLVRDQNYEWLGHVIRIAGQLDPRFMEAYRFGSLILAWDNNRPDEAIALLREGMANNQMSWEMPFQVAFVAYVKAKDYDLAAKYFSIAARLPEVWSIAPRWAAVASRKSGNFEVSREIWTELLTKHQNARLRELARRQLLELLKDELKMLQSAVDRYREVNQRLPASLDAALADQDLGVPPREPFGGRFELQNGRVVSSSVEATRRLQNELQRLADRYAAARKTPLPNLDALVAAGYLPAIPANPLGAKMTVENGKVLTEEELP